MAQQELIDAVKVQLPDEAADLGFTDAIISALLDSGTTQTKAILAGWRMVAAKTATYTDVSESGSSRNMSALNVNAREMISIWQAQSDKEDTNEGTNVRQRFASYTATRV